jgi:hypothetical protein
MPYITFEEEVWVDLDDFETEDLVEELKKRNTKLVADWAGPSGKELADEIYMAKHVRHQPYDHLVDQLLCVVLGKVL